MDLNLMKKDLKKLKIFTSSNADFPVKSEKKIEKFQSNVPVNYFNNLQTQPNRIKLSAFYSSKC